MLRVNIKAATAVSVAVQGGRKSSLKQRAGPISRTGRQSTSSVPEHVKHPEKFTVYELHEELVVGGGDQSSNALPAQHQVYRGFSLVEK